jgi:uncharacterized protein (TIGR03083 family)
MSDADAYRSGWLPGKQYDALRAADFQLFCEAASRDLTAHVPTCPEWDVAALCDHLARVYQGRASVIEHKEWVKPDTLEVRTDGDDPIAWVTRWSDGLDRALAERDDDSAALTFMPEAAAVHFWRRRMALETLVHRTDAEIAQGDVSAMDDELSADGVDELLWFGTHPENDDDDGVEGTSAVMLTDGTRTWAVELTRTGMRHVGGRTADATVRGSAPALLLALSGRDLEGIGAPRFGVVAPLVDGDPAAYARLRARLGEF